MVSRRSQPDGGLTQSTIELRHDVEMLSQRCQRLYEEANELVVRLRELTARSADCHGNTPVGDDPRCRPSAKNGDGRHAPFPHSAS